MSKASQFVASSIVRVSCWVFSGYTAIYPYCGWENLRYLTSFSTTYSKLSNFLNSSMTSVSSLAPSSGITSDRAECGMDTAKYDYFLFVISRLAYWPNANQSPLSSTEDSICDVADRGNVWTLPLCRKCLPFWQRVTGISAFLSKNMQFITMSFYFIAFWKARLWGIKLNFM